MLGLGGRISLSLPLSPAKKVHTGGAGEQEGGREMDGTERAASGRPGEAEEVNPIPSSSPLLSLQVLKCP